jgi:hypothetical protein
MTGRKTNVKTVILAGSAMALICGVMSCDTPVPTNSSSPPDSCAPKAVKPDTAQYENIAVLSPLGCEDFVLGDTLHVQWHYYQATRNLFMVDVELSLDDGETFSPITPGHSVGVQGPDGTYDWVIPESAAYASDSAVVRVYDYSNPSEADQSYRFSIRTP